VVRIHATDVPKDRNGVTAMDSSQIKRTRKTWSFHRAWTSEGDNLFADKRHIVELISMGAPLSGILNVLCDSIDVKLGNMISLVVLSDDEEHDLTARPHPLDQCGLYVFCCAPILSESEDLLGTLTMFCCDPRSPTPDEVPIIERITHLAAVAIQKQNGGDNCGASCRHRSRDAEERRPGSASFIN
jgi:hypothetical protein